MSLYQIYKSLNYSTFCGAVCALALVEVRNTPVVKYSYKVLDSLQAEWIFSIRCRAVEKREEEASRREVAVVDGSNGVVV